MTDWAPPGAGGTPPGGTPPGGTPPSEPTPPGGPTPSEPTPSSDASRQPGGRPRWIVPALALVAMIVAAVIVISVSGDDDPSTPRSSGKPGEVFTEPADDVGPTPFTDPVVTINPNASTTTTTTTSTTIPPTTTTNVPTTVAGSSTSAESTTTALGGSTTLPGSSTTVASSAIDSTTIPPTTNSTPAGTFPPSTLGSGGGNRPTVVPTVPGNTPGLYGGTRDDKVCDAQKLVEFLQSEPAKARAWAKAQGITPEEIPEFVSTLTPVLLGADTRVTNFGYVDGEPVSRQVVLQKGTGVFVDKFGVPRARCKCGNPLAEPVPVQSPTSYTGSSWPGFDPNNTQVVTPSPSPIDTLVITDNNGGGLIDRPTGQGKGPDTPSSATPPGATTTTTTTTAVATTTTISPTTLPPTTIAATSTTATETGTTLAPTTTTIVATTTTVENTTTTAPASSTPNTEFGSVNLTYSGDLQTSSEYPGGQYPVALAFDSSVATSWFSSGDADVNCVPIHPTVAHCSDLRWLAPGGANVFIKHIEIYGNTRNADPAVRSGFGFGAVTITATDATGAVTFQQSYDLPGDETALTAFLGVETNSITFTFEGHDSPDCGGISELFVYG